jgi:hypothetical protein
MHANDFIINHGAARQAVESIAKLLPHFDRKPTTTLIIKAIDSINASAFVVSAQEEKVFGVLDLVGE